MILFGGSTKKGQQADIEQAMLLHHEYKYRKKLLWADKKLTTTLTKESR